MPPPRIGKNLANSNLPMSERQQLALLMQMSTSKDANINSTGHFSGKNRDRSDRSSGDTSSSGKDSEVLEIQSGRVGQHGKKGANAENKKINNVANDDNEDLMSVLNSNKDEGNTLSKDTYKLEEHAMSKDSCNNQSSSEDKNSTIEKNQVASTSSNVNTTGNNFLSTQQNATTNNTSSTNQTKRSYLEIESLEEIGGIEGEESKRKKRKETSSSSTESNKEKDAKCKGSTPIRQDKLVKQSSSTSSSASNSQSSNKGPSNIAGPGKCSSNSSNILNSNSSASLDGKSPCGSPKVGSGGVDAENDDSKNCDHNIGNCGPKVPPLKIVIPQSMDNESGTNTRNGKNNSTRNHSLPYVLMTTDKDGEKDNSSSRCNSPADNKCTNNTSATSTGSSTNDEKSSTKSSNSNGSNSEERAQQRVLRSSNRNADRSSNNSSPQMQGSNSSVSPSPNDDTKSSEHTTTKLTNTSNPCNSVDDPNTSGPATFVSTTTSATTSSGSSTSTSTSANSNELHPRKRKIKAKQDDAPKDVEAPTAEIHPHDHPFTNCYQMFMNIRKQIEKKHKNIVPIQPRPPQGFKDYLMNRKTYLLASRAPPENIKIPVNLPIEMKELFIQQEKARTKLKLHHIVEKEKLGLSVEQEILRVHAKAARSLACQSLPFSACTMLRDEEVYNMITPEQEEKDRNARSRYNGRLFLGWLQDVDDKWEKIKEFMILRHHNEAESLHAVQKMDWEFALKEHSLCEFKTHPEINELHVPIVPVSDEFDLLPA